MGSKGQICLPEACCFEKGLGQVHLPKFKVNGELYCGLQAAESSGSRFPMSSPSLEPSGPGSEGSSYGVRGWREDCKEGVNE